MSWVLPWNEILQRADSLKTARCFTLEYLPLFNQYVPTYSCWHKYVGVAGHMWVWLDMCECGLALFVRGQTMCGPSPLSSPSLQDVPGHRSFVVLFRYSGGGVLERPRDLALPPPTPPSELCVSVFVCMCVFMLCLHVCVSLCVCVHACLCVCMHVCFYVVFACVCFALCVCTCVFVCLYACVFLCCVCTCVFVCMCVFMLCVCELIVSCVYIWMHVRSFGASLCICVGVHLYLFDVCAS